MGPSRTRAELADEFNATARLTRLYVNVIAGRIAPDDVEAVKAINSEVRDLLVGRFHGSNHMSNKIGPPGCCCEIWANEDPMMAVDMIGFMESIVSLPWRRASKPWT